MITFFVQCEPVPAGRPRFTTRSGFARAVTPKRTRDMRALLTMAAREHAPAKPLEGPLVVRMGVYRIQPKSYGKRRRQWVARPDLDNFVKLLDAFNGVLWLDDSQIVELHAEKRHGDRPGFMFEVEEVEP